MDSSLQVKTLLEVLTSKIAASPSKFCVGDSLTIADLQVRGVFRKFFVASIGETTVCSHHGVVVLGICAPFSHYCCSLVLRLMAAVEQEITMLLASTF